MPLHSEAATERTALLYQVASDRRLSQLQHEHDEQAQSTTSSTVTKEEQQMASSTVGERLPYNDYTTIDWLHDLVKDSYRFRYIRSRRGLRYRMLSMTDACSGWLAVIIIGTLTACVAFIVDVAVATVSDWKLGYCTRNPFLGREACCRAKTPLLSSATFKRIDECKDFRAWATGYTASFAIYVVMALVFGAISSSATMLTKSSLPSVGPPSQPSRASPSPLDNIGTAQPPPPSRQPPGKTMYMAAGSGIPEIKTILSGFVIPHFLSARVLVVKAFGAVFAVATGMCLGKEGPFVHISTCMGSIVGHWVPKYALNGRKMRELLSAACAAGLSVAFGAPIGGVLFSYEEISSYFPRKVLWRAFLCSLVAAMVLKALNPMGTGKLVLFETQYGTDYAAVHYLIFIVLGACGGVFGGVFCRLNFLWSKWFRAFGLIRRNPVLEVLLVVLATALLQFPNPLTREPGDVAIKMLLVDCKTASSSSSESWVCAREAAFSSGKGPADWAYIAWLLHGTLAKLLLTVVTFGCKVPSGVIVPALGAGALFGRLLAQPLAPTVSPGIFAMVGAAAFLAGVSRMTISLAVIMFELTGELGYTIPHMIAILVAKWVADAISAEGVYDLAQTVLGHPFLDPDVAMDVVRRRKMLVDVLVPPQKTMRDITVEVPSGNTVAYGVLRSKLERLRERGLMDAGLVLVQVGPASDVQVLQGYISQSELEFGLERLCPSGSGNGHSAREFQIRLLGHLAADDPAPDVLEVDLSPFVDRTPLSICEKAPLEYAVEMFSKLGLRYLCVTEEGTGRLIGVVIKKRLVGFLERLKEGMDDE